MKQLLILFLLLLPACTQYEKKTFEISVKNETARPLSLGLVKNGPPREQGWIAPHEVAMMAPQLSDRKWGWVLQPGEARKFGPYSGKFEPHVQAILRIYAGTPTIEELIAFSKEDPERLDIYLWPGKSGYLIRNFGGRLQYRVAEAAP
ncbi:MAG TPA: hypothetical protein VGP94_00370 [Tepidisphaeraceae bacterium]|nr:hypothetical protein [Tepidisphaeraceae bacterium]